MPVVSNTSPILNLAIIGRLNLLYEQFEDVAISEGVREELRSDEGLPGCEAIRKALQEGWIHTEVVHDEALIKVLCQNIDCGEAESIALALQIDASILLLDERDGRAIAKSMSLQVIGILGVLMHAKFNRKIESLEVEMLALKKKAGFYISQELFETLLKEAGEL